MKSVKFDSSKPPMDLLPSLALEEIAKVLGYGAKKYGRHNQNVTGFEYSRLISAALRHVHQFNAGQDVDEESGRLHIAHAACCLMFLIEQHVRQFGSDDRYNWSKLGKAKRTVRGGVLSRDDQEPKSGNKASKKRTKKRR